MCFSGGDNHIINEYHRARPESRDYVLQNMDHFLVGVIVHDVAEVIEAGPCTKMSAMNWSNAINNVDTAVIICVTKWVSLTEVLEGICCVYRSTDMPVKISRANA